MLASHVRTIAAQPLGNVLLILVAIVAYAPVTALTFDAEWDVWPYTIGTGALQLLYFALLATAYRTSSLSLVYPIARGVAPVLVLLAGIAVLSKSTSAIPCSSCSPGSPC